MRRTPPIGWGVFLLTAVLCLPAAGARAACTNPPGSEADVKYNSDFHTYQFCNGTSWLAFGGGSNCAATGSYSPTTPSGSGYFVLSGTQYNGSLGGRVAADALCYTELTTTNTSWKGYSAASANGLLTTTHIHAFICDEFSCTNLMPLTTYSFAVANNAAAGGANFTTDSNGLGPNDSANWSAANYFSGIYNYWSNRSTTSSTQWGAGGNNGGNGNAVCVDFNSGSSGLSAQYGSSGNTDSKRWWNSTLLCNNTINLICFVNP